MAKKNEIAKKETVQLSFDQDTVDLIKRTVATNATDDELKMFLYQAKRTGLDPLARQIYFMKRNSQSGPKVSIQTSIDGFRVVAGRQGDYAGQDEPEFVEQGANLPPVMAKVKVYKFHGNQRYLAATGVAYWNEYVPSAGQDFMWKKMPHTMIAKVAEALALRKAFPQDLSGIYTDEEMSQDVAGTPATPTPPARPVPEPATEAQRKMIFALGADLGYDGDKTKEIVKSYYKLESFTFLKKEQANKLIDVLQKKVEAKAKQPVEEPEPVEAVTVNPDDEIDVDEVAEGIEQQRKENEEAADNAA